MMEYTTEQLVEQAIGQLGFVKRGLAKFAKRRHEEEFYAYIAQGLQKPESGIAGMAQQAFGGCHDCAGVKAARFSIDPANLDKILEFLKYLIETLVPLLLPLIFPSFGVIWLLWLLLG